MTFDETVKDHLSETLYRVHHLPYHFPLDLSFPAIYQGIFRIIFNLNYHLRYAETVPEIVEWHFVIVFINGEQERSESDHWYRERLGEVEIHEHPLEKLEDLLVGPLHAIERRESQALSHLFGQNLLAVGKHKNKIIYYWHHYYYN